MSSDPPRAALDALYDDAACGLLVTEVNGTIVRVNRTLVDCLGHDAGALVGKRRLQDLLTIGCKIFHQTHWMPLLQIQGSVAEVQLELVHREGHPIPVLVNAVRREQEGEVRDHVAVFVATDRRKYERELLKARKHAEALLASEREAQVARSLAESELRLALDSAHLLVWSVDVTGNPVYDPGVRRLLGLSTGEPVTAEIYEACIHPDDYPSMQAALRAAFEPSGGGHHAVEYRLLGRDGVERVIRSSGRAYFDDAGKLVRFSGVLHDVTDWRRAEKVLREQEREAQARAVLAEQLVGIVSHDLRTPLNAVLLGAKLLAASAMSPSQARTVERIGSAAHRAGRLIADLLDFTQARLGGGLRIERTPLDLHSMVSDGVEELKLTWPGRMIAHETLGEGMVEADADRLAQVLTNLVNNAMTYGTSARAVTIRSEVSEEGLVLEVHNDGAPIPDELLPHLFEPLRRGEQQVRLGSRSVGLGLYIVQQIARAHGGNVTVRSRADEGTAFTVRLPRVGGA